MRTISIVFILISALSAFAHNGEDHEHAPTDKIENGKITAKDQVIYYDAGSEIQWAGQKLKRKITENNQVLYQYSGQYSGPLSEQLTPLSNDKNSNHKNYLELKVPGGDILKSFAFDHAGELHDFVKITSPDFSDTVTIAKNHEFTLRWEADPSAAMIKIIIEVFGANRNLTGHLTVTTKDDGEFNIPTQLLGQLPEGPAKIAVRRIWLGEFQSPLAGEQRLGVRTAVSSVAKAKIIE